MVFPLEDIKQEIFDAKKLLQFQSDDEDDLFDSDGVGVGDVDRHGDRQFTYDVSIRDAWTLEFTLSEDEYQ